MSKGSNSPNSSAPIKKSPLYDSLEEMMFGFGDSWPPDPDSVQYLETLVKIYIEDLISRSISVAEISGSFDVETVMYLVRKDRKKFNRVHKLVSSNEELKKANNCLNSGVQSSSNSSSTSRGALSNSQSGLTSKEQR